MCLAPSQMASLEQMCLAPSQMASLEQMYLAPSQMTSLEQMHLATHKWQAWYRCALHPQKWRAWNRYALHPHKSQARNRCTLHPHKWRAWNRGPCGRIPVPWHSESRETWSRQPRSPPKCKDDIYLHLFYHYEVQILPLIWHFLQNLSYFHLIGNPTKMFLLWRCIHIYMYFFFC